MKTSQVFALKKILKPIIPVPHSPIPANAACDCIECLLKAGYVEEIIQKLVDTQLKLSQRVIASESSLRIKDARLEKLIEGAATPDARFQVKVSQIKTIIETTPEYVSPTKGRKPDKKPPSVTLNLSGHRKSGPKTSRTNRDSK